MLIKGVAGTAAPPDHLDPKPGVVSEIHLVDREHVGSQLLRRPVVAPGFQHLTLIKEHEADGIERSRLRHRGPAAEIHPVAIHRIHRPDTAAPNRGVPGHRGKRKLQPDKVHAVRGPLRAA